MDKSLNDTTLNNILFLQILKRLCYAEAVDILQRSKTNFEFAVDFGKDLQSEHERFLNGERTSRKPVIVYDYPKTIKPFYMRLNDDRIKPWQQWMF